MVGTDNARPRLSYHLTTKRHRTDSSTRGREPSNFFVVVACQATICAPEEANALRGRWHFRQARHSPWWCWGRARMPDQQITRAVTGLEGQVRRLEGASKPNSRGGAKTRQLTCLSASSPAFSRPAVGSCFFLSFPRLSFQIFSSLIQLSPSLSPQHRQNASSR